MKERYNSEKDLKNTFDSFKIPLDESSFETFKAELDKEEKRRKFIWWIFYGKFIAPVMILGLFIAAIIYLPDFKSKPQQSSANTIDVNSAHESIELKKQDLRDTDLNNESTLQKEDNDKSLSEDEVLQASNLNDNKGSTTTNRTEGISHDLITSNQSVNKTSGNIKNGSTPISNQAQDELNSIALKIAEEGVFTSGLNENTLVGPENYNPTVINDVEVIKSLNGLSLIEIDNLSQCEFSFLTAPIIPRVEKYQSYFYFNLGAGLSKDDNFGQGDPFFEELNPTESLWNVSAAYQFSHTTAIELGLMRKNISLGFKLRDFSFMRTFGNKVNILRARLIHKLWSPNNKLNIHMSNGVALVKASSTFNDGFGFSNGRLGIDEPPILSDINLDYEGLFTKNHFMYTGGLSIDYNLFKNVDLNIGVDYNLGFKTIAKSNLDYISGEAILTVIETNSNASFGSLTLGLKYRLRKD